MNTPAPQRDTRDELRRKLNGETSRMPFDELVRFFAAGVMIVVSDGLDLVEVAVCIAEDDTAAISNWMQEGRVARASDTQAKAWMQKQARLWAVVVKPWVLVQDKALRDVLAASGSVH